MDISDSGFISPAAFSANWQDITLLQQRNHNCLYTASRYGKRYVLKGLSADCQSLTDMLLLQQKEFSLGITLSHPNIAETYFLEEVADCGRCIVMEYVDGITLAEWLATNPSKSARQRVMLQLLDALEYIHSLQLVHHDLKSSNILITRNGQNVKLIDFGLSELDTTNPQNDSQHDIQKFGQTLQLLDALKYIHSLQLVHHDLKSSNILITRNGQNVKLIDFGLSELDTTNPQNDIQHDIQKFGEILQLLFPSRYKSLRQQCQNGRFANMAAIRLSIEKRQRRQKYIPYIIAIIILTISALLSIHTYRLYQESEQMAQVANEYIQNQQRQEEMLEKMNLHVNYAIESIKQATQAIPTYYEIIQHPILIDTWNKQQQIRDSIANEYIDDPVFYRQYIDMWTLSYSEKLQQLYDQWAKTKPKY